MGVWMNGWMNEQWMDGKCDYNYVHVYVIMCDTVQQEP